MGTAYNTNVVTDGLVACWDAGNRRCGTPSDGGTWNSLGANAPAVLHNDAGFADVNMGVIALDGTDEKVTVANTTDIDGQNGFTFGIWLYFLATPNDDYTCFSIYNGGATGGSGVAQYEFMLYIQDASASIRLGTRGTNYSSLRSDNSAMSPSNNIGKWVHYCATYNGDGANTPTNYKIYFNGQDMGSDGTTDFGGGTNTTRWGDDNGYGEFNGYIGRVAFYNRPLSADEVSQNYEALKPRFAPRITKSGLVGNWDAGDPASYPGGTTLKDTANGTAATFSNMDGSNFNSANGGYWEFDGTNEYIQCSTDSVLQPQSFSVEAWVKDDQTEHYLPIVGWKNDDYPSVWTSYHGSTQRPMIYMNGSDFRYFDSTAASVAGWHHVVFTYTYDDITTGAFYVDGVSISTFSTYDDTKTSTNTCTIGATLHPTSPQYYKGDMGLVRIYDRPLSAAEILDNYQKTKARFGH